MSASPIVELRRRLNHARRELRAAVERWQRAEHDGVDFLHGHRVEAARQVREIRDLSDELVRKLGDRR